MARLAELGSVTAGGELALVEALGSFRSDGAGRALATLAAQTPEKELRKAARRGLHRLRAAGIMVDLPTPRSSSTAIAPMAEQRARLTDAHATPPDGVGSRALWLGLERPLGGMAVFGLVLNDSVGMRDCSYRDTTRRKLGDMLRDWRAEHETPLVELPPDYALSLVSEALALNAESGQAVPTEFQIHRRLLGELPEPPQEALIHHHVSRGQALLLPNLLDQSPRLFDEEELKGWFFGYDETIERARELRRVHESPILLAGESREGREELEIERAIGELFTPRVRRAIRRRLEEAAYVFWVTRREQAARQAVAAAFGIGQGALARHPFARALVEKSLELALEAERAGVDPALLRPRR